LAWGREASGDFPTPDSATKPKVYSEENDWKKFLPPIGHPSNLNEGWINIGEAYLYDAVFSTRGNFVQILEPYMIFLIDELHIILKLRNL